MEDKIKRALRQAQIARDELKISTLRLLLSEINNAKIAKGVELTDEDIIKVVQREVKKRREAEAGFRLGGREEAAKKELAEGELLIKYLPEQLSNYQLQKVIDEAITNLAAKNLADMGKVIGMVMSQVGQRAEPHMVSVIVKEKLTKI